MPASPRLLLSAGEASGDRYAAELATRLREITPDLQIAGIGGNRLREITPHVHSSTDWGAVSIVESLKVVPRVFKGARWAIDRLRSNPPGLFLPIDYGYLNVRLARKAKQLGWKVLYFVPPGSWRRTKQGADLPQITDHIVTPFPWSADILNQMGAQAHFFGHPLKQMVAATPDPETRQGIAVLPGSREHEVKHNLPVIADTLNRLAEKPTVAFAVAANLPAERLQTLWQAHSPLPATFSLDTYAVLKAAQAALVCSGTATLEAALCGCPHVVLYRGSKWMEFEYRLRKPKFDYLSLPNILLDRPVLPELIQWDATPDRIAQELAPLLTDTPARQNQLDSFHELTQTLGPSDALDQTARLAETLLQTP